MISVAFVECKSGLGRLLFVPTQRANACMFEHDETFRGRMLTLKPIRRFLVN